MTTTKAPNNVIEFPPLEGRPIGDIPAAAIRKLNDYELILLNLEVSKIQIQRLAGQR